MGCVGCKAIQPCTWRGAGPHTHCVVQGLTHTAWCRASHTLRGAGPHTHCAAYCTTNTHTVVMHCITHYFICNLIMHCTGHYYVSDALGILFPTHSKKLTYKIVVQKQVNILFRSVPSVLSLFVNIFNIIILKTLKNYTGCPKKITISKLM